MLGTILLLPSILIDEEEAITALLSRFLFIGGKESGSSKVTTRRDSREFEKLEVVCSHRRMWCYDWGDGHGHDFFDFNFENYKDHYKVLELSCDASDDEIRSSFIRLALKWHPDKFKEEDSATSRFQEINEAYQVLSDPYTRQEFDKKRMRHNMELLNQYKELILTCNGLGMKHYLW